MKKRSTRKKFKKIVFFTIFISFILFSCVLFFLFMKDVSIDFPMFSTKKQGPILNPNATYSISDVRNALAGAKIQYTSVQISSASGSIRADLPEGTQVYFSYEKSMDWQISSLQSLLRRLTIESKAATVIDLRYNRPIVKFSE